MPAAAWAGCWCSRPRCSERATRCGSNRSKARKILAGLAEPIDPGNGHAATLGASIGISVFPDNGMEIDRQHRQIVDIANRLNDALRTGEAAAHVGHLFDELLLYTRFHFPAEERFMARYGYPARDEHEVMHAHLLEEIEHVRERMLPGSEFTVLQTVKDWLLDHIVDSDKDLGIFLSAKHVR